MISIVITFPCFHCVNILSEQYSHKTSVYNVTILSRVNKIHFIDQKCTKNLIFWIYKQALEHSAFLDFSKLYFSLYIKWCHSLLSSRSSVLFSYTWDRTNNVVLVLLTELSVQKLARQRYDDLVKGSGEYLVSGSDDFTLFLWTPEKDKKSIGDLLFTLIYVWSLQMEKFQFVHYRKMSLS